MVIHFQINKHRLIMILYENIPDDEMPDDINLYVARYTYIEQWNPHFMNRLLYRMAQNRLRDRHMDEEEDVGHGVVAEGKMEQVPLLAH